MSSACNLLTASGLMASLVDTVRFARDQFDLYEKVAFGEVHQGEYKAKYPSVEAVRESEYLIWSFRRSGPQPN